MARFFSQSDIDEFKECFFLYAKNGIIGSNTELSEIMRSLGFSPTVPEVNKYFAENEKDGKIDFATFLDVMHVHSQTEKCQQEIMAAFQAHDTQRKGYIPAAELMQVLTSFGERLNKQEVQRLFQECNIPPNGQVKYAEMLKMMLTPLPDY